MNKFKIILLLFVLLSISLTANASDSYAKRKAVQTASEVAQFNSAMDRVLTGTTYWYANEEGGWGGTTHNTYNPQNGSTRENDEGNIRCVRTAPELMAD